MLNSNKILKMLKEMDMNDTNYDTRKTYEEIINYCMEDIKLTFIKETGGSNYQKRYKAVLKYLKDIDDSRPQLKLVGKDVYNNKNCFSVCNGFTGVFFYADFQGLPMGETVVLSKVIQDIKKSEYAETQNIDLAEIRKLDKITSKNDRSGQATLVIGNQQFDCRLIVPVLNILGDNVKFSQNGKEFDAMLIENENGVGIVLPLRK